MKTTPLNSDMTFHESYGMLPVHILRMVKRMNISPADYDMLTARFDTDWDAMRNYINKNRHPETGSFTYPFGE